MSEIVVFETNKGVIEVEMNRAKAPVTVDNFVKYVKDGFFDGTIFHRVIPGFMIQGGGFAVDGKEKRTRPAIRLESKNGLKNTKGTIAMARTNDPDSATSQFFINLIDNGFLNASPSNQGYAVFGQVIAGMDVVQAIEKVKTGPHPPHSDWPRENIIITHAHMKA
jgi:cyclophilin family peptidyl-prolyl cis-trans isomerase